MSPIAIFQTKKLAHTLWCRLSDDGQFELGECSAITIYDPSRVALSMLVCGLTGGGDYDIAYNTYVGSPQ